MPSPLASDTGDAHMQIVTRETEVEGLFAVDGILDISGADASAPSYVTTAVQGLYVQPSGQLTLLSTQGGTVAVTWGPHEVVVVVNGSATEHHTVFNATLLTGLVKRQRTLLSLPAAPDTTIDLSHVPGDSLPAAVRAVQAASLSRPSRERPPATARAPPLPGLSAATWLGEGVSGVGMRLAQRGGSPHAASRGLQSLLGTPAAGRRLAEGSCAVRGQLAMQPVHATDSGIEGLQHIVTEGRVASPNCRFSLNVTLKAVRADPVYVIGKANAYAGVVLAVSVLQLAVLVVQIRHSDTASTASRLSMVTVGSQAIADSYLCLVHLTIALVRAELFTMFGLAAFTEMLLFSVLGMRLLLQAWKAQHPEAFSNGIEVLRRELSMLYLRFYCALIAGMLSFFYLARYDFFVPFVVMFYASIWVPQIVRTATTNFRRALHPAYLLATAFSRLAVPLYIVACPVSLPHQLLGAVYRPQLALWAIGWVALQCAVVLAQTHWKPRFFIPASCFPKPYDYRRPVPSDVLARINTNTSAEADGAGPADGTAAAPPAPPAPADEGEDAAPEPGGFASALARGFHGARARMSGYASVPGSAGDRGAGDVELEPFSRPGAATVDDVDLEDGRSPVAQCVVCMDDVPLVQPEYMLTPCGHAFHGPCLEQWMRIKMECPTCRAPLPPVDAEGEP